MWSLIWSISPSSWDAEFVADDKQIPRRDFLQILANFFPNKSLLTVSNFDTDSTETIASNMEQIRAEFQV